MIPMSVKILNNYLIYIYILCVVDFFFYKILRIGTLQYVIYIIHKYFYTNKHKRLDKVLTGLFVGKVV